MFSKKKLGAHAHTKHPHKKKRQYSTRGILKFIAYLLAFFIIAGGFTGIIVYKKYIEPLPAASQLKNLEIAQSSTIYDKDGNELYKIFKEKRTYVDYEQININMVNAIVAGEDKRYWENPGIDVIGLFRAVFNYVTGKTTKLEGTSTISQQLIRNTIITNERKIERKIKEMYLSYAINKEFSKEKILELYLNKISFWSNAYGIEQAAQTFFNLKASELGVLEASILASLPKWPSYYSPYNHPDRVIGYPYVYSSSGGTETAINLISKKDILPYYDVVEKLSDYITGFKAKRLSENTMLLCGLKSELFKNPIRIDSDGCSVIEYSDLLSILNSIKISSGANNIEYQTGRKDFILGRMLEDGYIDFESYRTALLESFWYAFKEYRENIKYPYFVFYVKEYLEAKYGKEVIEKWGLKIYTTLDPKLQDEAEALIEKYGEINQTKFDANNAALISLDNTTGNIIAMVGGRDYFDTEIGGNNNMITSRLQPGSTFKPFTYALAMSENEIGSKTPIYDLETEFPSNYIPGNFDGKFMGKMNVSTALNNSRNIPAVKMYFLAGGENNILDYMEDLWVDTLKDFKKEYYEKYGKSYTYGASMALWSGLMTPLELAKAYSVYANMGVKREFSPIIKVIDANGVIIEERQINNENGGQVIPESHAYLINSILSDTSTRPEGWNSFLTLKNRKVSAKTGTSTKQYTKGGKDIILPRNLWTAGYTPQITTVVWAGNTDGTELSPKGNGLEGAGPIWKDFMEIAHQSLEVQDWKRPSGIEEVKISTISGFLPTAGFNEKFITSSLFLNTPTSYDNSLKPIVVDALCNGRVTDDTPPAAVKEVYYVALHSLAPDNSKWEQPVQTWMKEGWLEKEFGNIPNIITTINDEICERSSTPSSIEVGSNLSASSTVYNGSNYIEFAYRSSNPIVRLDVLINNQKVDTIELPGKLQGVYAGDFQIPSGYYEEYTLSFRAVDNQYYSVSEDIPVMIQQKDTQAPQIRITNPIDQSITLYDDIFFNLRGEIDERTPIRSINIYANGTPLKIGLKDRRFTYEVYGKDLKLWENIITVEAVDLNFNKWKEDVRVLVIQR